MSCLRTALGCLPVFLLIAACGGAAHTASSSTVTTTSSAGPTTTGTSSSIATTTSRSTTATLSRSASATTQQARSTRGSTASTTSSPGTTSTRASHSSAAAGGATNVRVPATFRIGQGGKLNPPTVSSPAFIAVWLTLISTNGAAHKVVLRTPMSHSLSVPANGRGSILIPGQRAGNYPLYVDGSARGELMIGGEPGP